MNKLTDENHFNKSVMLPKALSIFLLLYLLFTPVPFSLAAEKPVTKRILVIYSYHEGLPWDRLIDNSLRATLVSKSTEHIELNVEHADRIRYPGDAYLQNFIDLLRRKYSHPKMDVVIGIDDEASALLLKYGEKLFPGVQIVFVTAERKTFKRDFLKPNMTSLLWGVDIQGTVDLICKMLPKTRQIFVISGSALGDCEVQEIAREALRGYTKRLEINYLAEITQKDLMDKVEQLPERSVLLYLVFSRDSEGRSFVPREIMSDISQKTNVPMFGIVGTYLGFGIVGGRLLSAEVQGKRCAEIALQILGGQSPAEIPPEQMLNKLMFDWRQLKRWDISEDKLPAGSIVRYRPFSIWGQYRWHIIGVIAFFFIETFLIIILCSQIIKRRKAEIKVCESEERYALAVRGSTDGLWDWKTLSGEVFYSDRFKELIGYSPDEFPSKFDSFRDHLHPEDLDTALKAIEQHFQQRVPYDVEYRLRTKQGEYRWFQARGQAIWNEHGKAFRMAGSIQDINERKQMEKKSRSLQAELTHASRVLAMGEIAASLAHELNQPLTAIQNYAQAAERFLAKDRPDLDEVSKSLSGIVAGNRRAIKVIQNIRMALKKEPLERAPLHVKDLIQEIIMLVKNAADEKKVVLRLDLNPGLPHVFDNRIQLEQVILNLIINGFEAMHDVDDGSRELVVRASKGESDSVTISVQDSGIGIDDEERELVFNAFFTTKDKGMGMGLSISRSIIEDHGGRIWATQNPDTGTTFSFTVPIHKEN